MRDINYEKNDKLNSNLNYNYNLNLKQIENIQFVKYISESYGE